MKNVKVKRSLISKQTNTLKSAEQESILKASPLLHLIFYIHYFTFP